MRQRNLQSALVLIGFLALSFIVALSGIRFQPGEWYEGLSKPSWTPPNSAFGPAWTMLYIIMATSAWMVWKAAGIAGAKVALVVYLFQLLLNASWSLVFFGLHRMGLGFVNIVLLWFAIAATAGLFSRHHKVAAILLVPYLLWVGLAGVLNFTIWQLNA
jgi:tryptophan-rich sensory protein